MGEPVTSGQVVEVLALDAPWAASPTATTTVPLPEEMVAEVVGLLEEGVVSPFPPASCRIPCRTGP